MRKVNITFAYASGTSCICVEEEVIGGKRADEIWSMDGQRCSSTGNWIKLFFETV